MPGIHQDRGAGSVSSLGHSRLKAAVAEQSRLGVSDDAGDGYLRFFPEQIRVRRYAEHLIGAANGWQKACRYSENGAQLLIPPERADIEQGCPAGIGVIRGMDFPACQLPEEPTIHRPGQ
ncbi:hypothetical protein D3C75_656960 [compost metagenome]